MKSIRQRLTILINQVNESVPEGSDVYGFSGISRETIVKSLRESYDLLGNLDEHQEKFEVIFLQRTLAQLFDDCRENLKGNLLKSAESKFDDFLTGVQRIRFVIRETYVAITEHPIRVDTELKYAKGQLTQLKTQIEELSDLYEKLEVIKSTSETLLSTLEERDQKYEKQVDTIETSQTEILSTKEQVAIIAKQITEWQEQIKSSTTSIATNKGQFETLVEDIESLKSEATHFNEDFSKELKSLKVANERNKEQQGLIQKTIEDANRAGMAGSFKKRKDELRWTLVFWQFFTIASLGLLIYLSYILVKPLVTDPNWEEIVVKLPIIASCVWLCWFSAKQFGFTARIREDYSYKYAVSMAFEGYKNAAKEINADLLEQLLSLTVLNISKNPISIYDSRNNHGSPINEIIDSTLKKIHFKGTKDGIELSKESQE